MYEKSFPFLFFLKMIGKNKIKNKNNKYLYMDEYIINNIFILSFKMYILSSFCFKFNYFYLIFFFLIFMLNDQMILFHLISLHFFIFVIIFNLTIDIATGLYEMNLLIFRRQNIMKK